MSGIEDDCLLVIMPEHYHRVYGYEIGIIWVGVKGIHMTGYYCGHDLFEAISFANNMNIARGYKPEFVSSVLEAVSGISKIHFFEV